MMAAGFALLYLLYTRIPVSAVMTGVAGASVTRREIVPPPAQIASVDLPLTKEKEVQQDAAEGLGVTPSFLISPQEWGPEG